MFHSPSTDNICAYVLLRRHVLQTVIGLCPNLSRTLHANHVTIVSRACINVSTKTDLATLRRVGRSVGGRLKDGRCERRDRLNGNTSVGPGAWSGESENRPNCRNKRNNKSDYRPTWQTELLSNVESRLSSIPQTAKNQR